MHQKLVYLNLIGCIIILFSRMSSGTKGNKYCSAPFCEVFIMKREEERPKMYPSNLVAESRSGSFDGEINDATLNLDQRLAVTLKNIRAQISPTIASVETDIFNTNVNSIVLALSNGLGGIFGMIVGSGGNYNLNQISGGAKIQVLAQAMYGYGYSTPWSWRFEDPRVHCGRKDLEETLAEYDFLLNPDPSVHNSILTYYISEFSKTLKSNLYCLVKREGGNQEAKELVALLDLYVSLLNEKLDDVKEKESSRKFKKRSITKRSSEDDSEAKTRLKLKETLKSLKDQIPKTIKSVEKDIFQSNVNNIILSVSNGLGALFGILAGTGGQMNFNKISGGSKIQVIAQTMYGYGYSRPYVDNYQAPNVQCGLKELEEALAEYDFLESPDPDTDPLLLGYYASEFNHEIKKKLFCLVSETGGNQEAKELEALIDLYTNTLAELF